jgi:hypothetical protein
MMQKTLITICLALLLPLGSAGAASPLKKFNSLDRQKVCLTSAGWCAHYSTRSINPAGVCECGRSLIGRVTVKAAIHSSVPNID